MHDQNAEGVQKKREPKETREFGQMVCDAPKPAGENKTMSSKRRKGESLSAAKQREKGRGRGSAESRG